jgi:hypothetical protein
MLAREVRAVREIPEGYAIELPWAPSTWLSAAEFLIHERSCCPFLDLALEAEREDGPIRIRLTGRAGVKEFIGMELQALVHGGER